MAGIHTIAKNNGSLLLFRCNTISFPYYHPYMTPFYRFMNRWSHKQEENQERLDAIHNALNDPTLCCHYPSYDTTHVIVEAATSDQISLDGVFFFLRREPDVLQKLLLLCGNHTNNNDRTTKRNSTAAPNTSTTARLISTKKTKTK